MTDAPNHLAPAAAFAPASREQWRKLVDAVLKGARFEDRLIDKTADGLTIQPLYPRAPDATPVAGRAPGRPWQIMARIDHPDPDACNAEVLHELDHAADGLVLIPAGAIGAHGYGLQPRPTAIARTLAGVHLDAGIQIALEFSPHAPDLALALADLVARQGLAPRQVDIHFGLDPLGAFALSGGLPAPWRDLAPRLTATIADLARRGFQGPFALADGRVVHNAGGTEAQELAFALASAVAYLRALEAGGIALDAARRMIAFRLAADTDQFLTIAKFRALRQLWQTVEHHCGLTPEPISLAAETAWRTLTRDDVYGNILRATIAVFSANVGGADGITVLPFTSARGLADRFARRVARNTQLILREEAGVAWVSDPTAGTGWSEDLTSKLCGAAWALFQEIETAGGAAAALEQGLIQKAVAAARITRERALLDKTEGLIGANEYPEVADVAVLDIARMALADPPAAVTAEPLRPVRFAAPFEPAARL
jgi:methylmalonyl-CoA mutase